jgi:tetratricopeptide (TPR) repeat protein
MTGPIAAFGPGGAPCGARHVPAPALLIAVAAAVMGVLPAHPLAAQAPQTQPTRVWDSTLTLPSYAEGAPDPNPPFDLFADGRPNYPYTIRDRLTDRREPRAWRAIWLENDFLRCTVLPELGGHLYSCTDKVNGQEMFYANGAIKLASIAYRGAWAAFGVEFNFPVSHNWMTTSPVDVAFATDLDGSGSVWVGNIDRVYGTEWIVQLTLRAGRAVLEQNTTLMNRSEVRRRFYWWTNAGVRVTDDSRIIYPMKYTASHGFRDVDTWPVDRTGTDLSVVGNHRSGPVSRFAHGSREPFMAVYHPRLEAGLVHYSAPTDLPAKKIWSWSADADGLDWRRSLSDDSSAYVEIQAGLFRDQETYAWLQPQERIRFSEYWLPIRQLGGLVRATPDAALNLWRETAGDSTTVNVALNVTRGFPNASVELRGARGAVSSGRISLSPATTYRSRGRIAAHEGPLTFTLRDRNGALVLTHTEGVYDYTPDALIRTGAVPERRVAPPDQRTEGEWLEAAEELERGGAMLGALAAYRAGLAHFPSSLPLERAAGRLAVSLMQYRGAEPLLYDALARASTDYESAYYLALARLALGDTLRARLLLDQVQQFGALRPMAVYWMAALDARAGDLAGAYARVRRAMQDAPGAARLGAVAAMLARAMGRTPDARSLLATARGADPVNVFLRWESHRVWAPDTALLRELAADPERILEIATEYLRFGLWNDALDVLSAWYPTEGVVAEPGMPRPERYPLLAYYRGWLRQRLGQDGASEYEAASRMPLTYVFPNRPEEFAVLGAALAHDPRDASAHALLGDLAMSGGMIDSAIAEWRRAAAIQPRIPALHRDLGYALLASGRPAAEARAAFEDGVRYDSLNTGAWVGLDSALVLGGASAADRARSLDRFPVPDAMPASLVYRYARLLAEAGRFDDAERQFRGRFFPRREGGVNPRQVWLDVRLRRAEALTAPARCAEALRILDGLARPVQGVAFTRDGLVPFVQAGALADRVAALRMRCQ